MSSRNEHNSLSQTTSDWKKGNAAQVPQPPKGREIKVARS